MLSAYVFIETVAAIVIQTAVRQFLAVLYLDSLRQTKDSFDVAQRVLFIEESCIEESMNASSRATSSVEHETHDYSYETLIDDDLDVNVLRDDPIASDVFPVSSEVVSIDEPPVPVSL